MKNAVFSLLVCFPLILLTACDVDNDVFTQDGIIMEDENSVLLNSASRLINPDDYIIDYCGDPVEVLLTGGRQKNFTGGTLWVGNDAGGNLFLKFQTNEGWYFSEVQLYVGDWDGLPTTNNARGNPKIGKFADVDSFDPALAEVNYMIPAEELVFEVENESVVIVAHAVVVQLVGDELVKKSVFAEWDENYVFSGSRWGGGFLYEFQACEDVEEATTNNEMTAEEQDEKLIPESGDETVETDETDTNDLVADPLTLSFVDDQFNLIIGQETVAGFVNFSINEDFLTVEFNLTITGWLISEVHINIGALDELQFGNSDNPKVGYFDYVYHYDVPGNPVIYQIPVNELSAEFLGGNCEIFTVHATLVDETDYTLQKSAFVEWDENLAFSGTRKGGSFLLCPVTETN